MFTGSNIATAHTRVDLSRCAIDPAYLTGSVRDPDEAAHSRLEDIQRRIALAEEWVISRGAKGRTAVLDDEDLRVLPKGLTGRSLAGASFRRICGVGMDFSGAVLVGAVFNESDLRDADFSRSDLRGASFQDCRLDHARFDLSDLRSIETAKGRCAVSFFGSKLVQTRFDGAKVDMGSDHTPPSPTFGDSMARSRQERLQGAKEECPDGYRTIHP
ncbi:pentapeptide repeat-containing protein [Brevundimonas sp.]|uniref:pentapeptide repeat-containing protein n=1 Tax=Brevundimonas sp. TaxID=1871086 RepID=UPI0025F12495|nr:pentapeptide repeat-containing protein [Brevundimonas sp.]